MEEPPVSPPFPQTTMLPGTNTGTWAETKFTRGIAHTSELFVRIRAWQATMPLRSTAELVEPNLIEYRLDIVSMPPIEEWSAILGDALHNFRAALDAVAWAMATWDGAVPTNVRAVYFPMAGTEKAWKEWSKLTPTISDEFRLRVRSVQPFVNPQADDEPLNALTVLHQLDIVDKHREAITVRLDVASAQMQGATFGCDAGQTIEMLPVPDPVFEQGAPIIRLRTDRPFRIKKTGMAHASTSFAVAFGEDKLGLEDILNTLANGVRVVLNDLYGFERNMPDGQESAS